MTIQTYLDTLQRDLEAQKEQYIRRHILDYVEVKASQNVSVVIRPPWWMPNRLYRWLLRQIVVTEGDLKIEAR